jgi:lipoprotein-anchoring transpeptidase ErfK/SrfK
MEFAPDIMAPQGQVDGEPIVPARPLGARALYLRSAATGEEIGLSIHGTPTGIPAAVAAEATGFRLINQEVIDLFERVPEGTLVVVR